MKAILLAAIFLGPFATAFDSSHSAWDRWLKKYVVLEGPVSTVRYATAKSRMGELEPYLAQISGVTKAQFDGFSRAQKMAFLINAYNAFTVKLVLDHYPVKSIKDIGGWFSSPWKKKFFPLFGESTSLDAIEHERLRKDFDEPRIHFAIVCASKSCPGLWDEAFVDEKLEVQLERGTKAFLQDRNRNVYVSGTKTFEVSKIFDWFAKDFEKGSGTVQAFLASKMAKDPAEAALMRESIVKYVEYDWSLNQASETPADRGGS